MEIFGVETLLSRIQIDIPMSPVRDTAIRSLRWMVWGASCKVWLAVWGQARAEGAEVVYIKRVAVQESGRVAGWTTHSVDELLIVFPAYTHIPSESENHHIALDTETRHRT